jgi:hypothetical protein
MPALLSENNQGLKIIYNITEKNRKNFDLKLNKSRLREVT